MLINSQIITNLCLDAGVLRTQKAKQYKNQGRVEITNVEYEDKIYMQAVEIESLKEVIYLKETEEK